MSGHPEDWFRVDLTLRNKRGNPNEYTARLGIQPRHAVEAGSQFRNLTSKATVWIATLAEGQGQDDDAFSDGLQAAMTRLTGAETFLHEFSSAGGQSWLTINHAIGFDEGVLSSITLEPAFLSFLAQCDLALTLQGWSAGEWPAVENRSL